MATLAQGKVLKVLTFWYCPNCRHEKAKLEQRPHTVFHQCPKLAMMMAPMIPKGVKAKVVAKEREDYIGEGQVVHLDDNGRPIMSVVTERDDGTDALVFAPTALARLS